MLIVVLLLMLTSGGATAELPVEGAADRSAERGGEKHLRRDPVPLAERIAAVRACAEHVQIDGRGRDWRGVPMQRGRHARSRLLTEVTIAPYRERLDGSIRTTRPRRGCLWITCDTFADGRPDFALGFPAGGGTWIESFSETSSAVARTRVESVEVALGEVVEFRVGWEALAAELETVLPGLAASIRRERAAPRGGRRWVRVVVVPWKRSPGASVRADRGVAVASYRLDLEAGDLRRPQTTPKRSLEFPLRGEWYLEQGAFGTGSHRNKWAVDLVRRDAAHRLHAGIDPLLPPDYRDAYAFDAPVYSPGEFRVVAASTRHPDGSDLRPRSNRLVMSDGRGCVIEYAHLRSGSLRVGVGRHLAAETLVARVGNSGFSHSPHLHVEVREHGEAVPFSFSWVRVALNPVDCAWATRFDRWRPSEGFFVSPIE